MKNKLNNRLLEKASNIAHEKFWKSDCPEVLKKVKNYIRTTPVDIPKEEGDLLATYVSIVCYFSQDNEEE